MSDGSTQQDPGRFRAVPSRGRNMRTAGDIVLMAASAARLDGCDVLETLAERYELPVEEVVERLAQAEPYTTVLVAVGPGDAVPGIDVSHLDPGWIREPSACMWLKTIGFTPEGDEVRVHVVPAPYTAPVGCASYIEYCWAVEDAMAVRVAASLIETGLVPEGRVPVGQGPTVTGDDEVCWALTEVVRELVDGRRWYPGDALRWVETTLLAAVAGMRPEQAAGFLDRASAYEWATAIAEGWEDRDQLAKVIERAEFTAEAAAEPVDPQLVRDAIGDWGTALVCLVAWAVDAEALTVTLLRARPVALDPATSASSASDGIELEAIDVRITRLPEPAPDDPEAIPMWSLTCTPRTGVSWQEVLRDIRRMAWRLQEAGATRVSIEFGDPTCEPDLTPSAAYGTLVDPVGES
ncbi:hypothetical protein [Embleya sp. NPDC020630]|uniref:hypothetical protein n=1 Tax=Embleya sp. NPDC020630 TaxID=3363979 RepID=UPI00378BA494